MADDQQSPKLPPDWERIEADYRAGILSLREISAPFSVSHVTVKKRAEREGWVRDLKAKIQAKADALVNKQALNRGLNTNSAVTERQIIEANAERIAQVRGEHRADFARMRALVLRLLAECEAESSEPEVFAQLGEMMAAPDERGVDKLREVYQKAISLPQRIKGVKELAEAMRVLVSMEREAYGLDDKKPEQAPGEITITF